MSAANDRRLSILLFFAVLTMVFVMVFAVVAVPSILTGASNSQEVKSGNDLSSCRAQFTLAVSTAQAELTEAKAALDVNASQKLDAAVNHDTETLLRLAAEAPPLERDVTDKIAESMRARQAANVAIDRAIHDPSGFLADCRNN